MGRLIFYSIIALSGVALLASSSAAGAEGQANARLRNSDDMWVAKSIPAQLPTGVTHHTYHSACMKRDVGYCIYLPPSYEKSPEKRYPVIYTLHGATGNEMSSIDSAKVLHDGIISGRWPEIILVTPNGGRATLYMDTADGRFMAETTFMKELIPHIDQTYRTIAARHARCIEGFSMGGRGSTMLAMKYPEMFCSLFDQAGNVYPVAQQFDDPATTAEMKQGIGPDRQKWIDYDPYLNLKKNLNLIKNGGLRIQIFCGTKDDGHLPSIRDFHKALLDAGVDHTYMEIEDMAHERKKMIAQYSAIWFDYHVESMRRAAAKAVPAQ
jgi:endo-1,4-beta-xylanase